jgi:hypothetical protein
MTSSKRTTSQTTGSQLCPVSELRTYRISMRVNAVELAELERRRSLTGTRDMGTYARAALLAQRPPRAVTPELNRTAWLTLAEHLVRMQELARRLEGLIARPRGGLTGLVSRSRLEDAVNACLEELRAGGLQIQALRRTILGSEQGPR